MAFFMFENFCPELSRNEILRIAHETGFCKRVEKKLRLTLIYHSCARNP